MRKCPVRRQSNLTSQTIPSFKRAPLKPLYPHKPQTQPTPHPPRNHPLLKIPLSPHQIPLLPPPRPPPPPPRAYRSRSDLGLVHCNGGNGLWLAIFAWQVLLTDPILNGVFEISIRWVFKGESSSISRKIFSGCRSCVVLRVSYAGTLIPPCPILLIKGTRYTVTGCLKRLTPFGLR